MRRRIATALTEHSVATRRRLGAILLLVPAVSILVIALMLTPDPAGVGTHRQLGLGTCTVLLVSGWPCPMCGMTTTFSLLAHGHLVQGTLNQPFGLVLFGITVGAAILGLKELLRPRGHLSSILAWMLRRDFEIVLIAFAGLAGSWIYKSILMKGNLPW